MMECPKCGARFELLRYVENNGWRVVYECASYGYLGKPNFFSESLICKGRHIEQLEHRLEVAHRLARLRLDASIQAYGDLDLVMRHVVPLVHEREKWLWRNRAALVSVLRGMEDAAAGRLTDGPDLEADAKLIDIICDPDGGLYDMIEKRDARLTRVIKIAKKYRTQAQAVKLIEDMERDAHEKEWFQIISQYVGSYPISQQEAAYFLRRYAKRKKLEIQQLKNARKPGVIIAFLAWLGGKMGL